MVSTAPRSADNGGKDGNRQRRNHIIMCVCFMEPESDAQYTVSMSVGTTEDMHKCKKNRKNESQTGADPSGVNNRRLNGALRSKWSCLDPIDVNTHALEDNHGRPTITAGKRKSHRRDMLGRLVGHNLGRTFAASSVGNHAAVVPPLFHAEPHTGLVHTVKINMSESVRPPLRLKPGDAALVKYEDGLVVLLCWIKCRVWNGHFGFQKHVVVDLVHELRVFWLVPPIAHSL